MRYLAQGFIASQTVDTFLESASAERSALAAEVLRNSGRLRMRVRGYSMLPTLWPRDVVEIASCSIDDAQPGEIVLALRNAQFFLHRFLARCQPCGFLLQGDSMPAPDPKFPDDALLGRLVGRANRGADQMPVAQGLIFEESAESIPAFPLSRWSWAMGRLLCHCPPVHWLALRLHDLRQQHATEVQNSAETPLSNVSRLGAS